MINFCSNLCLLCVLTIVFTWFCLKKNMLMHIHFTTSFFFTAHMFEHEKNLVCSGHLNRLKGCNLFATYFQKLVQLVSGQKKKSVHCSVVVSWQDRAFTIGSFCCAKLYKILHVQAFIPNDFHCACINKTFTDCVWVDVCSISSFFLPVCAVTRCFFNDGLLTLFQDFTVTSAFRERLCVCFCWRWQQK